MSAVSDVSWSHDTFSSTGDDTAPSGRALLVAPTAGVDVPLGGVPGPLTCQAFLEEGGVATLESGGLPPIAARLSCGISCCGGGGIGVCVHGASASATSIGV